jgi:AsmA family protein
MANKLKILLLTILALTIVGALGIWYAISSIDQAQLTRLIGSSVKEATGRDLKIAGPVHLTIFPSVGLIAQDISLSNAAWAKDPYFVKAKRLDVNIHLLPLFSQRVEINRVELNGVEVFLQTNTQGSSNWVLAAPLVQGTPSQATQPSKQSSDDSTFVAIEGFNLKDARISYRGGSAAPKIYQIQALSLQDGGGYTLLKLDAQEGNTRLGVRGKITSIRKIVDDWNQTPVKIQTDLSIDINGKKLTLTGDVLKKVNTSASFDMQLNSKAFDLAPLLGGSAIAASGGKIPSRAATRSVSPYFFSPEPPPFDLLPVANGRIDINIGELSLPGKAPLKDLTAQIQLKDEQIDFRKVNFKFGAGSAQANAQISDYQGKSPSILIEGQAMGYSLEQVLLNSGGSGQVQGGDTRIAFNLRGNGNSLHQIMGGMSGKAQILIGKATVPTNFINAGGDFVVSLFDAINPLRKKTDKTILDCAVAYFPVSNGLVSIKDSVGFETDRLDVVLSGNINLKTESINLNIYPREKSGLTTGLDLANLVKVQGTLQNPELGINKEGVVNSAVAIGLGFLTGGASILAENARSMTTKSHPCKTALHPWANIYPNPK